ncbi:glycerol kinase, partial [bacterium]|nr:glycerol kinase [bacterium]
PIERPVHVETTALGAAFLAGRATGFWKSAAEIAAIRRIDRTFEPALPLSERNRLVDGWRDAIKRTLNN